MIRERGEGERQRNKVEIKKERNKVPPGACGRDGRGQRLPPGEGVADAAGLRVCIYIYIYIYTCIRYVYNMSLSLYIYMYVYVCVYISIYLSLSLSIYIYIY